jgi:hypothetical protein
LITTEKEESGKVGQERHNRERIAKTYLQTPNPYANHAAPQRWQPPLVVPGRREPPFLQTENRNKKKNEKCNVTARRKTKRNGKMEKGVGIKFSCGHGQTLVKQ